MLVNNKMNKKIGFMQGRFSPSINKMVQVFPWDSWRTEFMQANKNGFEIMEWVIEQERLLENPIMNETGREEIRKLMEEFGVSVSSVTCDTFIQEPFYKAEGARAEQLLTEFKEIIKACSEIGVTKIVVPLVDKGSLDDQKQEMKLSQGLDFIRALLIEKRLVIAFESDFPPERLKSFISGFDDKAYGINYDVGNSASLGFDFEEEITAYGDRIVNVHIKDRTLHGATVPLGSGNADISYVLRGLQKNGYQGNYILQTARDFNGQDEIVLCKYRDMVASLIE